jgi:hypothetical protein
MKTRGMGFGFLLAAGVFLWNPTVNLFDPLPDLIGYVLLSLGISKLADLNDFLRDAQKGFSKMLFVGGGYILAELLIHVFLSGYEDPMNRYESPVWVLLFSFVFMVLEFLFAIPAWKTFWRGLEDLARFGCGTAILAERKGKSLCERLSRLTTRLIVLRSVFACLPELSILTSFEYDDFNPHFGFDWYEFVNAFRYLGALVVGIFGIVWLVRYSVLFISARKDAAWQSRLQERYNTEILPQTGMLLCRRIDAGFSLMKIGAVFSVNLVFLHRAALPDWMCAIFIFAGLLLLGKQCRVSRLIYLYGALLGGIGIARAILNADYLEVYVPLDAAYLSNAYVQYLPLRILGVCESVIAFLLFITLMKALMRMIGEHTEVDYGEGSEELSRTATERMQRALSKKGIKATVLISLSAICKIMEAWLSYQHAMLWLLQVVASVCSVCAFWTFLLDLFEEIKEKYDSQTHNPSKM